MLYNSLLLFLLTACFNSARGKTMNDDQRWWRLLEASCALRRTPARRVVSEVYPNFRILDPDDLPTRAVFEFLRELLAALEPRRCCY